MLILEALEEDIQEASGFPALKEHQ